MGIIFDLDGTLVDTLEDIASSCNAVLARHGYPTHAVDAYRFFVGNGMKKLLERALPETEESVFNTMLAEFLDHYNQHYLEDSKVYPGVIETLKTLNDRGIAIAICTNKKQEYTDKMVAHFFEGIHFAAVIGDRFDGLHKPHPAHALEIAAIMNEDPKSLYFVGDSNVDMMTAHSAAMIPIGVSWGFRPVRELEEHGAVHILNTMNEILVAVDSKKW